MTTEKPRKTPLENKHLRHYLRLPYPVKVRLRSLSKNDVNENVTWTKHLGNGDYLVNIASSSHPLLLTEHAANGLVEAPLK